MFTTAEWLKTFNSYNWRICKLEETSRGLRERQLTRKRCWIVSINDFPCGLNASIFAYYAKSHKTSCPHVPCTELSPLPSSFLPGLSHRNSHTFPPPPRPLYCGSPESSTGGGRGLGQDDEGDAVGEDDTHQQNVAQLATCTLAQVQILLVLNGMWFFFRAWTKDKCTQFR